jgi:hypothetical protein
VTTPSTTLRDLEADALITVKPELAAKAAVAE